LTVAKTHQSPIRIKACAAVASYAAPGELSLAPETLGTRAASNQYASQTCGCSVAGAPTLAWLAVEASCICLNTVAHTLRQIGPDGCSKP